MSGADDIAGMMDLSFVTDFLDSLEKKQLCERVFSWKRIVAGAIQAKFALAMITEEYWEKVSAYRRTVSHFEDDVCTAYTLCYAFRDEKQELANLLAASERRERRLRKELRRLQWELWHLSKPRTEDDLRNLYQREIEWEISCAEEHDCMIQETDVDEEMIRFACRNPRAVSDELKPILAAPFITLRSSSLGRDQIIRYYADDEVWMTAEDAASLIDFAIKQRYYTGSNDRIQMQDEVLNIETIPLGFHPSGDLMAEVLKEIEYHAD